MPPYICTATVTLSDVAQANVVVRFRNENNNETTSATTDSNGRVIVDLNNLTSDYAIGDIITAFVSYQNYEVSVSHTIAIGEGGHNFTLALVAIAIGDLNYCTIQDVYDYLSLDSTSTLISTEVIRKIGLRKEDQIERRCNTVFHSNDGSYTTVTTEYHDVKNVNQNYFFVRKRPIIAMSAVEANIAEETATANWTDITTDAKTDLDTGRVDIVATTASYPYPGSRMMRFTYTYGFATTPEEIRDLAILLIVRELMRSNLSMAVIQGRSEFTAPQAELLDKQIEEIFKRWTFHQITNV